MALNLLEEKLQLKEKFSKELILEVQAMVEKGASKEKIGLRGAMPPGVLFAVYDSVTGRTARLMSGYILDYYGYNEKRILSKISH